MKTSSFSTAKEKEKAILVTCDESSKGLWKTEDRCNELKRLTESCDVQVVGSVVCHPKRITPNLFIGKGKALEVAELILERQANVVIFNNDLSSSQQKNLEELFNTKTIDKTQLILDIFAHRATSNEGKVQVELAQLLYLLPRLTRLWLHFSRQRGGIGTRGAGEQQLEVDRRRVRERISKLKRELKTITRQRDLRRVQREKFSMLTVAMVGYTNSGKSTLFNALTKAKAVAKDQLFSTLDPTVRKMSLSNNQTVLLADTVGFLHELPHHLIESFKATLEEVVDADILFHVVDLTSELIEEQAHAVHDVLKELRVDNKPLFTILNKCDLISSELEVNKIKRKFDNPVVISALYGEGLSDIDDLIVHYIQKDMEDIKLVLPHKHYAIAKMIREKGLVREEKYDDEGLWISARVPRKVKQQIFKRLKAKK